jgi:uroporphyrin-III C-methyltransferase/precorrin-2 dehydrogenase/sirohydrochlorin ferrochelatase
MRHFPIYIDMKDQRVIVVGGGDIALSKLRLLLKTEARIDVFETKLVDNVRIWEEEGRISVHRRFPESQDFSEARLVYCATGNKQQDMAVKSMAESFGALVNIVDNLDESHFITPAVVDRDPVTVAIGTEGTAPVLARVLKARIEEALPAALGVLACFASNFRRRAEILPKNRIRRKFWDSFFNITGPTVLESQGKEALPESLEHLVQQTLLSNQKGNQLAGHVFIVGAGPGNMELLTIKARKILHEADVVIHDRLVPSQILDLARRDAVFFDVGKKPAGASWKQEDINNLMIEKCVCNQWVVRLKSGDPSVFGRLDEEIAALKSADISYTIVPGVTAASAVAAVLGVSLTCRGRNRSLSILTGHDTKGFAEHDWKALARPGAVAAIYMGASAARFIQGRLLLHGGHPDTPVSIVENASLLSQKVVSGTLSALVELFRTHQLSSPVIILLGLSPAAQNIVFKRGEDADSCSIEMLGEV